jgi:LPS-assembly protein
MAVLSSACLLPWLRRRLRVAGLLLAVTTLIAGGLLSSGPAFAQSDFIAFPTRPPPKSGPGLLGAPPSGDAQMLVQATEINYDYANNRVSAVGNVQIYYNGSTIEADKVVYDQKAKRLRAEGNVRLTESNGQITYGEIIELSDDYRDGFVDSLRVDTAEQTRMAAARGSRTSGTYTVFESGIYTACEACKEDPKKPPLWQVKAARILHDEGEKMIYFEDAKLEFFGVPLAWLPYFSAPDPTVKRKSGFLMPQFAFSNKYGASFGVPYFWALAPNYDVTVMPTITTRQGVLLQGEFRHRLESGAYSIRAAGINQLDKSYFVHTDGTPTPGFRDWRGSVETSGQFALNRQWNWGWNALVVSDKTFYQDYGVWRDKQMADPMRTAAASDYINQLYLVGRGERSYFDARAFYFQGLSEADAQTRIPVVHPVVDYTNVLTLPFFGGEFSYSANLTSLSRAEGSFDPITNTAVASGLCATSADPAKKTPTNCLLRGIPGAYTRFSAESHWKRSFTDSLGQVFTPFFSMRADAAMVNVTGDPSIANFTQTGEHTIARTMPTVGLEYRYPFIAVHSWGTQTVEPIAQLIVRPDESQIGRFPNEDAQSLVFDDSNLFRVDKFSGWDRAEGGSRANVGLQYTAQIDRGGFVNALFGQSYHLFGTNSFAVGDLTNTGLGSGLDTDRSDYVARLSYQPDRTYTFSSRYRFDHETFEVRRFEVEAKANYERWQIGAMYGDYAAQPELGFLTRRQGILGSSTLKISTNWAMILAARYDINAEKFNQTRIGLGYVDDCLILALNYITDYTYSGNPTADHRVLLQLSLRTLGGTALTQSVGGPTGGVSSGLLGGL